MEKKTLLAVALSFLILIFWYTFIVKPPEKPIPEDTKVEEETEGPEAFAPDEVKGEEDISPTGDEEKITADVPADTDPHAIDDDRADTLDISVKTPLYTAVISTNGGMVTEFYLEDYNQTIEEDSPLMNLIPEDLMELYPKIIFHSNQGDFEDDLIYTSTLGKLEKWLGRKLSGFDKELIFILENERFRIEKVYSFDPETYGIDLHFVVTNLTDKKIKGDMSVSIFHYLPPQEKKGGFSLFGMGRYTYTPRYLIYRDNDLKDGTTSKLTSDENEDFSGNIAWLGFDTKYFISALIVKDLPGTKAEFVRENKELVRGEYEIYTTRDFSLSPGEDIESGMTLYMGPKETRALGAVDDTLNDAIDYGFFAFLSIPLVWLLVFFYSVFKNYGVAIILLTIVVRVILYPITHKSMKSMKAMQKLQPMMKEIREKHKDDRERMNQEVMQLYKTHKINPLGGCLPLLLQLPIFIALYKALYVAIELRHSPFCFWIQDLAVKDPYYVTPIVMGLSYFLQQKLTPTSADPTQKKIMMLMPVVFTFIFLSLPAGLVLYFFVSNLLSIAQQLITNRLIDD